MGFLRAKWCRIVWPSASTREACEHINSLSFILAFAPGIARTQTHTDARMGWRTGALQEGWAGERPSSPAGRASGRAGEGRKTGGRPAGHGGPKPRSTGRAGKGHCHPVPRSLRSPFPLRLCARGACAVCLLRCPRGGGCPGRSAAPLPVHPCLVPRRPPPSQSLALPLSPSGPPLSQSDSKQN